MNLNVVKKITIRNEVQGLDSVKQMQQAHERTGRAIEMLTIQSQQYAQIERQSVQIRQATIDSMNRLAAANDNLAKSYAAANDNVRKTSDGFRVSGTEVVSLTNHLKQAAVVLYSTSSAFRGLVHASVVPALRGVSVAVAGVGAAVNIAGAGFITGGAALAALGPRFAPIAAGITSAGQAMAAFSPTLTSLAVQASGLFSFLARVAFVVVAVTTAFNALVSSVVDGIKAFAAFQTQQVELQNLLNATGGASGRTAKQINTLADEMGDIGNSRQAAKALLEFQSISGETFDRALRAANDLAASGFGSVQSAASAMGKALTDPQSGLDGLAKAGVTFSTAQKAIIVDLIETGRRAEAYNQILDIVNGKVGGASAASANTLASSYRELQDAVQRGNESFGETIVKATNLTRALELLAFALNALNGEKAATALNTIFSNAVRAIPALNLLTTALTLANRLSSPAEKPVEDGAAAKRRSDAAAAQIQYDAIQKVILAIADEQDALRKSELQRKIDLNLRNAQAVAGSAEATRIIEETTSTYNLAQSIKEEEEARRQAAATAARQAEQLRRLDSDRQHRVDQLLIERQAMFLSAEAALVLRLREEELAKERRLGIADDPKRIAQIEEWAKGIAKLSIENDRLRNALGQVKDIAGTFATSFVRDLANGVDVMDALRSAAANLGNTLIDIGTKKLVSMAVDQAAGMFGGAASVAAPAAILNATAVTMGATWIASAEIAALILGGATKVEATERVLSAEAAGTTLVTAGVATGAAINGPLVLLMVAVVAIGAAISSWSGASAKKKQEEEAQARAWEQWQAAGLQLASYFAKANGTSVGNIRTQLQEQQTEAERFIKLRSESQGFKSAAQENADPIIRQIREAYGQYAKRLKDEFATTFAPTIEAMKSGLGDDSPLFQAFQNVKSVGEKLQAFIADTEFVFGKGSGQVGEARGAAQQRALSLLQGGGDPLSEVQKRMQEIQGTARGLQKVLEDLGMSSIDAAKAIEEGVGKAVEALRKSFTDDLQKQINDLEGKGFLNSFADLFKKLAEQQKDNAALGGGSTDLINKLFGLSAQGIVDQFQLTGEAFQELIKKFPELNGLVKEFVDTAGLLALNDRLFAATNNTDTGAGKLAAFDRNADRERLEAADKGTKYLILLEKVLGVERAKIEEEIVKQAKQRAQSINDQIFDLTNDATTLDGQIVALRRKQERERLDEIAAGGENLLLLLRKFNLEEEKLRKEFNDRKIEEEKRAFEAIRDSINSAARNVLDYLAGLTSGPQSTLSPTDTLANAQALFQANIVLAQGDPTKKETIDAVNKFASVADNMEKAARAVYGSGAEYQQIRSQIISQGLALPTVQVADDPLVVAMRNAVTAIYILEGTTGGVNTGFLGLKQKAIDLANDLHAASTKANSLATDLQGISDNATALAADLHGISINATSLATDLGAISTNANTLAGKLDGVSTNAITLADKLGGPTGISARMTALGETLSGTGGVSQRLIDLAGTVGTGNDAALRDKMLKLAAEVNDAGGKAKGLGTDAAAAAAQAAQLALDAKESARQAGLLATNAAAAATKAGELATAVGSAALKADALATAVQKAGDNATELAKQIGIAATKADELAKAIGTPSTGVLLALITFGGSLNNIAGMLLASFDALDTDKNKALSYQEFVAGAGGTSTQALFDTFNALDINKDNQITQLELMVGAQQEGNKLLAAIETLIKTLNKYIGEESGSNIKDKIAGVKFGTDVMGQVLADVKFGNDFMGQGIKAIQELSASARDNIIGVEAKVKSVQSAVGDGTGLGSLQSLNATMSAALKLLNDNLTLKVLTVTKQVEVGGGTPGGQVTTISFSNDLLTAINKIVYNTYAIALNTATLVYAPPSSANTQWTRGILAQGGWVGGNLHSQGGTNINAERGEFMVNRFAADALRPFMADINRGHLPVIPSFSAANDNGTLVSLVRSLLVSNERLERELASFRKENGVNITNSSQHVREGIDENTRVVRRDTKVQATEKRQDRMAARVAT